MGVFCKQWTFPRRVHCAQYQYFLFYILLIWGGGCIRTQRTPPLLPTGLALFSCVPVVIFAGRAAAGDVRHLGGVSVALRRALLSLQDLPHRDDDHPRDKDV